MARVSKSKRRHRKAVGKLTPSQRVATPSYVAGIPSQAEIDPPEEQESWHSAVWSGTRNGARASRGFHFQDVVGAWLASRLASGELAIDRLIPEGFDDLQLEAPKPVQIEVKSRQRHLGKFPVGRAATHIVKSWLRHAERFSTDRRLVVVFEQGIAGWDGGPEDHIAEIPVARLIEEVDGLGASLAERVALQECPSAVVDDLKVGTTVMTCSWDDLIADMERNLGLVVKLPKAALQVIGRVLQSRVAAAVDANAEAGFEERAGFDRTGLVDEINATAELIDLGSIEHALVQGICTPVDKQPVAIGDAYYEGVSTQPGHVSAGLVVPRPDLVTQVVADLEMSRAVLLVGPSGVGKSAALWTLPFAIPGVLWFRVHRMSDDDVPHVVRLLRAHRVSAEAPVGLLVDAVGSGDLDGWSDLRQAVAAIPGVLLVGAARREDLFSLGDLADCTKVQVSLDEKAAATIHAGLARRGATNVPHWREAFEQSHGLTLEFTHLLTQGTRISDVIADQVADRIRGDRSLELRLLTLVATADRWSASILVGDLESGIGAAPTELRAALERLVEEHLLIEHDGVVGGIHRIRSRAIVDTIHRIPPPELKATVASVLTMLHGPALSRFLYEVLREVPDLEEPVLRALDGPVRDDVDRLVACLRGLELLDFYRQALALAEIAERHDVPPASRPLLMAFVIGGIEFPEIFPEQVRNAGAEMASLPVQSAAKDALLGTVALEKIASELATTTTPDMCLRLLKVVGGTSIERRTLLAALDPDSPLVEALQAWSLTDLGDCVSAARDVSIDLARAFVSAVGGTESVLKFFRESDPWIRELRVTSVDGELVGVARFLHTSDSEQGDPHERAVEIGRKLLRNLPDISKVDVEAVVPGGRTLEIGGIEHGVSKLLRKFDHHPGAIGWNQDRIRLARNLFGAGDTERLAVAAGLLDELAELVRDFGNTLVRSRGRADDTTVLFTRRSALYTKGSLIPPRLGTDPLSGENLGELNDSLSALITEVCDKVLPRLGNIGQHKAVSAYIISTVLNKYVSEVREQPWRLLGVQDAPPALGELSTSLSDIVAVLTEMSAGADSARKVINAARSGTAQTALSRAAERSRRWTRRRVMGRRRVMRAALRSTGLTVDVLWSDGDPLKGAAPNFAVSIAVESLADWLLILAELVPKLEDLRDPGESPLLVPVLKGRSVVPLAMKLITKLWPVNGLDEFEHLLPPPLEQRLTKLVLKAHSALQVCSGISTLGREGVLPSQVEQFLERNLSDYRDATEAILLLESDVVITAILEGLEEIRESVAGELRGDIEAGTFAANFAEGILGEGSREAQMLDAVLVLSLQWDSDPTSAVAWLDSLGE